MALKAGRVGVHPSQVDSSGKIINDIPVNVYTKTEVDTLLNNKVSNSHLKANNKNFYFAYDAVSDSYGYKLNGQGDFIPFNKGVSESGIYVANPLTTGLTIVEGLEIVEGGYSRVGVTGDCYFRIKVRATSNISINSNLVGFNDITTSSTNPFRWVTGTDISTNYSYIKTTKALVIGDVVEMSGITINYKEP